MNDPQTLRPSTDAQIMMQYDANKKNVVVAYLLWFFVGFLGVHRFYLGSTGSGAAMLAVFVASFLLSFVFVGLLGFIVLGIWWLVDAFLTYSMAQKYNSQLVNQLSMNVVRSQ